MGSRKESLKKKIYAIVFILVVAVVGLCVYWSVSSRSDIKLPNLTENAPQWVKEIIDKLPEELPNLQKPGYNKVIPVLENSKVQVHMIDVAQGDSLLIQTAEANVLIDSGERGQEEAVLSFLRQQEVDFLDLVIVTHPHSDHMGCMDKIIDAVDIGRIILPELPEALVPTTRGFTDMLAAITRNDIAVSPAVVGDVYDLAEGVSLTIVGPVSDYYELLNNFSIVTRLDCDNISFLFTGDMEKAAELDLLASGQDISVNILGVGHHGSTTSTAAEFLDRVAPKLALISCGIDNSYGHPHREVVERLQQRNIKTYRSDLDGTVTVESNGSEFAVTSEGDLSSEATFSSEAVETAAKEAKE